MILTKELKVKINNKNKIHFTELGYDTSKNEIVVKTEDLMKGSYYKIDVKCDICGEESRLPYAKYLKNYNKYNIYTCLKCSRKYKNTKTNLERYGTETPTIKDNPEKFKKFKEKKETLKKNSIEKLEKDGGKICIKCGDFKDINKFDKKKTTIDGRVNVCRDCMNKRKSEIYYNNREELLPIRKEQKKEYFQKNKEKVNKRQREYYHNKFKHTNRINFIWRSLLSTCLRRMNKPKNDKTINMLGYSALELKIHIESLFTPGMSWENHGEWHIDHKLPVSSFEKDTPASVVNTLSNLQPMWATTRIIDGVLYEGNLNKGKKY